MKTREKYKHRGEILQAAVNKTQFRVIELARRMHISRGTFYNHIQNPNLSFELLERYGRILDYDFTNDFPEMEKYTVDEPIVPYGEPATLDEAIRQRDTWKDKYLRILEKYNKLIEDKINKT